MLTLLLRGVPQGVSELTIVGARRYAHVVPQCLIDSPSAKWWFDWEATGGKPEDLVVHIELHADFDGLAVGWGIGNKKASAEECGEACRAHRRNPKGGGSGFRNRSWQAPGPVRDHLLHGQRTPSVCIGATLREVSTGSGRWQHHRDSTQHNGYS